MNWQQLYTASTPAEREELLLEMIHALEARQNKRILIRGRLVRERRRGNTAHFVGDRRLLGAARRYKTIWISGLMGAAGVTWYTALTATQPFYGVLLVIGFDLLLAAVLFIKPYLRWQPATL